MPAADPARRAVVTGLGAVMPIGNDFETYWSNLRNAVTGHAPDPVVRPDRVRGADRRRGARLRPERGDGRQDGPPHEPVHPPGDGRGQGGRRGVGHRLRGDDAGAARSRRRGREHGRRRDRGDHQRDARPRPEGPPLRVAVRDPGAVGLDGGLHAVDGLPPDGSGDDAGRRVRDVGHRVPRRAAADRHRRVRRRAGRRIRGAGVVDGRGGAREHGRPVEAERLARDRVAAVRRDPRRLRARRGSRRRGRRVRGARARPRRHADRARSSAAR